MTEISLQELTEDIARALSPQEFDCAAETALTLFDELNGKIIEERGVKLACGEGCGVCCSLRVDVFAHEVFLIARYIRSHFSAREITNLFGRLAAHSQEVTPLTPFEHATKNIRCPLLLDNRCTVYAVRPHSCRRHHSQNFSVCQYTFDHPADLESPAAHDRDLFRALTEAMQTNIDVYFELGFDITIYELGTALHEALHDPETWQRWRRREQAFMHASVTPAA
jgi:Fe-S-cluster containining protein